MAIYSHLFPYIAGYIFHVPFIADSWSTSITGMAGPLGTPGMRSPECAQGEGRQFAEREDQQMSSIHLGSNGKKCPWSVKKESNKKGMTPSGDFNRLRSGKSPS